MSGPTTASCPPPLEQQHARGGAPTGGHDGRRGVVDLALTGLVSKLDHGFVDEAEPVGSSLRELPAVRIDREVAVQRDARPPSSQSWASPKPQKPSASIHEMALKVNPS